MCIRDSKGSVPNPFANNEVFFSDNRGYDIGMVGDALRLSLANYMAGNGLDRPVHKSMCIRDSLYFDRR